MFNILLVVVKSFSINDNKRIEVSVSFYLYLKMFFHTFKMAWQALGSESPTLVM